VRLASLACANFLALRAAVADIEAMLEERDAYLAPLTSSRRRRRPVASAVVSVTMAFLAAAVSLAEPACGGSGGPGTVVHATDYNQKCMVDGDCTAVYDGDLCSACLCKNAAINSADAARYQTDSSSRAQQCQGGSPCATPNCTDLAAYCNHGTCAAR
jgi:hypothetical protein